MAGEDAGPEGVRRIHDETATALGMAPGTVKSTLHRALATVPLAPPRSGPTGAG
ncbi:sigma factor-like helix-turn-helix DNA-binding protein [Streptomyces sp. NPDC047079]|uniref:sigma factor-like helix-turn-helix DNA-binding protein n=1 Tax=Streptomyces sp. NPDC047079 TaxID=3154607 RepID=UPI0033E71CEB